MSQELSRMTLKRHERLQELQDVIARQLMEMDAAPDAASVTASSVVDYLSTYWAGQVVSFPKDVQYKLTLKELEIYDQYTGRNKDELARAYGMTPRGMGKLIQRIRDKIKAPNRAADAAGGATPRPGGRRWQTARPRPGQSARPPR